MIDPTTATIIQLWVPSYFSFGHNQLFANFTLQPLIALYLMHFNVLPFFAACTYISYFPCFHPALKYIHATVSKLP